MNVDAIILAAGMSKRMKEWKITLEFKGKRMIDIVIEKFKEVCERIIVVGGYRFDELKNILKDRDVIIVYNENYKGSMFTSVKKGAEFVEGERFFITPSDTPFFKRETILKMLCSDSDIIVPYYDGKGGHPVLFKGYLKDEILKEDEESNLKMILNKKGFERMDVDDEGILIDIDTMEDYERYKRIYR
uniref:Nucleotidyltransferase family protein n=1 Tax=candidate division WOR-3 bacterium TaxID=2052148 RepID=A0A7C4UBF3_UNCW3